MTIQQSMGILGGTFDPIHFGHLRLALEVSESLQLDCIHFIPCYRPPHRHMPIAATYHRVNMIALAIQEEPAFHLNKIEIECRQISYSIDTLIKLRECYPATTFFLVLGMDAFEQFESWHRFREILSFAHLVVAYRPPYQLPANESSIKTFLNQHLIEKKDLVDYPYGGGILLQPITALDISASLIRKQLALGLNPRYLLPETVYDYIQQHQIYRASYET
jgi:nicotinate-nucleotide adenylyltransferase